MQKLTTLEKVSNRIDALSANCFDQNVDVSELSFDRLDTVNIAGEPHTLKPIAQDQFQIVWGSLIHIYGDVLKIYRHSI